jgi:lysophospholipase L1-like esterase
VETLTHLSPFCGRVACIPAVAAIACSIAWSAGCFVGREGAAHAAVKEPAAASFAEFDRRARAGDSLEVVFFGASLTWGANATDPPRTSYRAEIARRLERQYPQARFHFHDAAIGGTGSQLGVFRLDRDVLARNPDLVFLDFSANDDITSDTPETLASYEAILRRLVAEAGVPTVQVIFPFKWNVAAKSTAGMKRHGAHLALAAAYGTAVGDAITLAIDRVGRGETTLEKLWPVDGVHPCDEGYQLFADAAWDAFLAAVREGRVCRAPAAMLHADTYVRAVRQPLIEHDPLPAGWKAGRPNLTSAYFDFLMSRWLDGIVIAARPAAKPGEEPAPQPARLRARFTGRMAMLFGEATKTSGKYRVWIDGKPVEHESPWTKEKTDLFDGGAFAQRIGGNGHHAQVIATGLDASKEHVLEIEPVLEPGQELRFESLCVAGPAAAVALAAARPAGRATGGDAQATAAATGGVDAKVLDAAAFAEWVDGSESAVPAERAKDGPAAVVVTDGSHTKTLRGIPFGIGRSTGPRHLRIGFNESVALGSVLVAGGGRLSVLKPDAAYPGDLADESQWIPAERMEAGEPGRQGVGGAGRHPVSDGAYASWILPAGTTTRALRFSHEPSPGDREMSGQLGGVLVVPRRFANVAPQALPQTAGRDDKSAWLVNERHDSWGAWDNGENGAAIAVSPERPEVITLTWPRPVTLSGLGLLWTGFSGVEVDAFTGSTSEIVREAAETSWRKVAARSDLQSFYPYVLAPSFLPFEMPVTTRAIRLRITKALQGQQHPHIEGKTKEGRRVWLGEVMAFSAVADDAAIASLVLPKAVGEPPPIPVKFTLPEPGVVTLVIEDKNGNRVRNLVSETPFPAGENTAWWDGSDDLLRDQDAAHHGLYHIPTRPVAPGEYKVRGLWRKPIELHYEFSIYSAGKPAWTTADNTGCWLTTHTPPTSLAAVPGSRTADGQPLIFMGASVAEGGHGLQWIREDGQKIGGQHWVGGIWTGAATLAVDLGPRALADHLCYIGSIWEGEFRLVAKSKDLGDKAILKQKFGAEDDRGKNRERNSSPPKLAGFDGGDRTWVLGGIAARDGKIVGALVRQNELLVVDVAEGTIASRIPLDNPRGLCFDAEGRLLALSGRKLVRFAALAGQPEPVITDGLDDPRHVTVDSRGRILVSDRGDAHQVKIFSAAGRPQGAIGKAGKPATGRYEPLHMNNPNGLAVDSQGRVWVAEADDHPRRVSVWSADGTLARAFYGPTEYGGGGTLDPQDRTRFFYKGLEFKLDWETATDQLVRVFSRNDDPLLGAHYGSFSPDTPLYPKAAGKAAAAAKPPRRYFTSCYTHAPTNGDDVAFIWLDGDAGTNLVAALGNAHAWPVLRGEEFRSRWPEGTTPDKDSPPAEKQATFAWSDANGDRRPQPDEVQFAAGRTRGVTVMNDLSFVTAQSGDKAARFAATIDAAGLPRYDVASPEKLGAPANPPASSGGNQALAEPGGWTITTNAMAPYSPASLGGMFKGEPKWSYPSPWPGLHASHEAAVPDRPGMVVGHTRLLGGWVGGPLGPMFCINGNMGNMFLFTADGLFVGTFFHDIRRRPNWSAPVATRNMDVTDVSLHDENFWPSITQTADGKVFLVDGARTSLVRVDGLDSLQAIPETTLSVTPEHLARAADWFARAEAKRQAERGSGILSVPLSSAPPTVDGALDDWPATTDWASIDRRGVKANFNSNSKPYEAAAAATIAGGRLFAAWRTTEKNLLVNSGETANAPFKHGGCLDIMLATDAAAPADRAAPVPGDLRLLVTRQKDKPLALVYRAKVPGTKDPVPFSSPWRTVNIDAVDDVSESIELATDGAGNYELSVPLDVLGWRPQPGGAFKADIGLLRGANGQTMQRVYWANKATAITADVPSEAELTPKLWGKWKIVRE